MTKKLPVLFKYVEKITNCSRCGRTHTGVLFQKFKRPAAEYTFFAICPHLHEPILMMVNPTIDHYLKPNCVRANTKKKVKK